MNGSVSIKVLSALCALAFLGCSGQVPDDQPQIASSRAALEETVGDGNVSGHVSVPDALACNENASLTVTLEGTLPPGQDIVFLMDSSGSLLNTGWEQERNFVSNLIATGVPQTGPAPADARVGVIRFATGTIIDNHLVGNQSKPALINLVNNLPWMNGNTYTREALLQAVTLFNNEGAASRPKLALLITDGNPNPASSQNPCASPQIPTLLNNLGIKVVIIGIGDQWNPNLLQCLVDSPSDIIQVADFDELTAIQPIVAATQVTYAATVPADFSVVGPMTASAGSASETAGLIEWTLPSIGAQTQTLSFELAPAASITDLGGSFDALVDGSLQFTPVLSGVVQSLPFSTASLTLEGCNPCIQLGGDVDADGVCGDVDNCAEVANSDQLDSDNDGLGDACDSCPLDPANDADLDGVCGDVDNCGAVANPNQTDSDSDGLGDACDSCELDAANDADGDGVCGDLDVCADTVLPESVPSEALGVNRFALIDDDGVFDTTPPQGKGPQASFTLQDTAGCSCEQIISALHLGAGHEKFGCSLGAMQNWVNSLQ